MNPPFSTIFPKNLGLAVFFLILFYSGTFKCLRKSYGSSSLTTSVTLNIPSSSFLENRNFFDIYDTNDMLIYPLAKARENKCEEIKDFRMRIDNLVADVTKSLNAIESTPELMEEIRNQIDILRKYDDLQKNSSVGFFQKIKKGNENDEKIFSKLKKIAVYLTEKEQTLIKKLEEKFSDAVDANNQSLKDLLDEMNELIEELEDNLEIGQTRLKEDKEKLISKRSEAEKLFQDHNCG